MDLITVKQLFEGISADKRTHFISIRAKTIPKLKKTGNPYYGQDGARFHKITRANGILGANWENVVNNALERQGEERDFIAGEHQWATYVNKHIVANKAGDHYYLRFVERSRKEWWFLDNRPVDARIFEQWMPKASEEIVPYRNYMLDHLLSVKIRSVNLVITERRPKHKFVEKKV